MERDWKNYGGAGAERRTRNGEAGTALDWNTPHGSGSITHNISTAFISTNGTSVQVQLQSGGAFCHL